MERLDYGAGTKYYPNPFLGLGLQRHHKQQQHGKQQFSLVALNPHAHTLGLQAQVRKLLYNSSGYCISAAAC
jgi:hypothetical protein